VVNFCDHADHEYRGRAMSLGLETWIGDDRLSPSSDIAGLLVTFRTCDFLLAYRLGRTASVAPFYYSFAALGVVSGLIVWGECRTLWPSRDFPIAGAALPRRVDSDMAAR